MPVPRQPRQNGIKAFLVQINDSSQSDCFFALRVSVVWPGLELSTERNQLSSYLVPLQITDIKSFPLKFTKFHGRPTLRALEAKHMQIEVTRNQWGKLLS